MPSDMVTHAKIPVVAGFALLLCAFGSAVAGPFEDGMAAFDVGDFAKSLQLWRPLADRGDPAAEAMLGVMYDDGKGVPQDRTEAAVWYRRAADQGNADGQFLLGTMYALGYGVPRDRVRARMWLSLAASRLPASESSRRHLAAKMRDLVGAKMTSAEIEQSDQLAGHWVATK